MLSQYDIDTLKCRINIIHRYYMAYTNIRTNKNISLERKHSEEKVCFLQLKKYMVYYETFKKKFPEEFKKLDSDERESAENSYQIATKWCARRN